MYIRDMEKQDAKALSHICEISMKQPWSRKAFLSAMENAATYILVCEDENDGTITGYCAYSVAADEAEVLSVAVHPDYRRRGIADSLFLHMIDDASSKDAKTLYLDVRSSNTDALGFYLYVGMEQYALRKGFYDDPKEDAFLFRMEI